VRICSRLFVIADLRSNVDCGKVMPRYETSGGCLMAWLFLMPRGVAPEGRFFGWSNEPS
jgi:hypothetical protein